MPSINPILILILTECEMVYVCVYMAKDTPFITMILWILRDDSFSICVLQTPKEVGI